jgi:preprotein translocase subunit SecE
MNPTLKATIWVLAMIAAYSLIALEYAYLGD